MAAQMDCSCEEILPDGKLPGDATVSILLNLPVKSLLKFKAVSKAWCSLISSPSFFKLHLHRQSLVPYNFLVSFGEWYNSIFGLVTYNHDEINTSGIDVLILESQSLFSTKKEYVSIIDSCNGLVCLYTRSCGLILWNPATRKYRYLEFPAENQAVFTYCLFYVEATNDFKLGGWTTNRPCLYVYSLSSDSWEKLVYDAKISPVAIQHPTFMSGCMHWLVRRCTCNYVCTCASGIATFNITDGAMSCFGVPDTNRGFDSRKSMCTLVIKGCLSIVINLRYVGTGNWFDVWVMVEYGVEESWVKRFTIQGLTQVRLPTFSWNDSEIVFIGTNTESGMLTFYDPFSQKKHYLDLKSLEVNQVLNYVESLASVCRSGGGNCTLTNN